MVTVSGHSAVQHVMAECDSCFQTGTHIHTHTDCAKARRVWDLEASEETQWSLLCEQKRDCWERKCVNRRGSEISEEHDR